ncbi:hypothetical protein PROFUN_14573 [Planoprotostelium fungivorum]|uniref:Uncharacterized protein n=1 Tax=Planoprotostelium fungivorum TaxID=1890364 RepID=A0A2P6MZA8_9EUKA|nr:hypothetical protein PROFUN_14573 [Planoprotostelium fungivorum]
MDTSDPFFLVLCLISGLLPVIFVYGSIVACLVKPDELSKSAISEEITATFAKGEQLVSESRDLEERILVCHREIARLATKLAQNHVDIVRFHTTFNSFGLNYLTPPVTVSEDPQSSISKYSKPITHVGANGVIGRDAE